MILIIVLPTLFNVQPVMKFSLQSYLQFPPELALVTANAVHHPRNVPEMPLELHFKLLCMNDKLWIMKQGRSSFQTLET